MYAKSTRTTRPARYSTSCTTRGDIAHPPFRTSKTHDENTLRGRQPPFGKFGFVVHVEPMLLAIFGPFAPLELMTAFKVTPPTRCRTNKASRRSRPQLQPERTPKGRVRATIALFRVSHANVSLPVLAGMQALAVHTARCSDVRLFGHHHDRATRHTPP